MRWPDGVRQDLDSIAESMTGLRKLVESEASRQLALAGNALIEEARAIVEELDAITARHEAGEDVGVALESLEERWAHLFRRLVQHLEEGRALLRGAT